MVLQNSTSIILTSCLVHLCPVCERLFSVAKFIRTDSRKSMSPYVFESIPLLKVNQTEWDALGVGKSMGKTNGMSFGGDDAMQHAGDNDDQVFYEFS
jgi:hypothetical protein